MKLVLGLFLGFQILLSPTTSFAKSEHSCSTAFFILRNTKYLATLGLATAGTIAAITPVLTRRFMTPSRTERFAKEFEMELPNLTAWVESIAAMEKAGTLTGAFALAPFILAKFKMKFQYLLGRALVDAENGEIGYQTAGLQTILNYAIYGNRWDFFRTGWSDHTMLSQSLRGELSTALRSDRISARELQEALLSLMKSSNICQGSQSPETVIQTIVWAHLALKQSKALESVAR